MSWGDLPHALRALLVMLGAGLALVVAFGVLIFITDKLDGVTMAWAKRHPGIDRAMQWITAVLFVLAMYGIALQATR